LRKLLPVLALLVSFSAFGTRRTAAIVDLSILFSQSGNSFNTLVIPIRRVNNLIVIEARIDTVIGNFILDTGSPHLVLNQTYYRGSWSVEDRLASNAVGSEMQAIMRTSVHNLSIRELYFPKITASLSDLGHIENARGLKILGLLGLNLFTSFEMVIDLSKDVMYLHRLDENGSVPKEEVRVKSEPLLRLPFRLQQNILTVDVLVVNKKLTFCLDTGAEINAISSSVSNKVLESFTLIRQVQLYGTGGSRGDVLLGTLNEITVGNRSFKNMPFAITRLEALGEGYGRAIQGMLGNSFLVKGIISINFVKKELCMYPFEISQP
jgi:hypothetical protein